MASRYLKRWRRNENTAVNWALYSSSSSEGEEMQSTMSNRGNEWSSRSDGDTVSNNTFLSRAVDIEAFEVPYYIESSESELDYDSYDEVYDLNKPTFQEELSEWAIRNNITRSATTELLEILRRNGHRLSKDARTLFKTPRMTQIAEKCGEQYLYFGI